LANASPSNQAFTNVPLLTNQFATPITTVRQSAFESDRKAAFLSRAVLLTDCKNGFSLSEFIGQIVEILTFFPPVPFGLNRFGASVLKKMQADEDAYFVRHPEPRLTKAQHLANHG
jgi:hypothetical protein